MSFSLIVANTATVCKNSKIFSTTEKEIFIHSKGGLQAEIIRSSEAATKPSLGRVWVGYQ